MREFPAGRNAEYGEYSVFYPALEEPEEYENKHHVNRSYANMSSKTPEQVRAFVKKIGFVKVRSVNPHRRLYVHIASPTTWIPVELYYPRETVADHIMRLAYGHPPRPVKIPDNYIVKKTEKGYSIKETGGKAQRRKRTPKIIGVKYNLANLGKPGPVAPERVKYAGPEKKSPIERFRGAVRRVIRRPYIEREATIAQLLQENKARREEIKRAHRLKYPPKKVNVVSRIHTQQIPLEQTYSYKFYKLKGYNDQQIRDMINVFGPVNAPKAPVPKPDERKLEEALVKFRLGQVKREALRRSVQEVSVRPTQWSERLFVTGKDCSQYTIAELQKILRKYVPDVVMSKYNTKDKLCDKLEQVKISLRRFKNES